MTSLRAVVTGGSGGIGGRIVTRLADAGYRVVNLDRAAPREATVTTVLAELADAQAIGKAFEEVDAALGGAPPDLLVCCASIARAAHILDQPAEDIAAMVGVNVLGHAFAMREAALRMRGGGGTIVVITSVAAEQGWAGEAIYGATKAAQKGLVQGFAVDLAPFGISVNAVGPGIVAAEGAGMSTTRGDPAVFRHDLERSATGRFTTSDEVADAVLFLARARGVTGQTLYVDNGHLAAGLTWFGDRRDALARAADDKTEQTA
jgi:NAD(P)-dependent dehydrogenase (short-subunit alcohol dehydrogenase family)